MTKKIPSKRKYDSSRRKAQAQETQAQILSAAEELFIERGYTGTTIESIAQKTGVALETVYSIFGNKRALLSRVVDMTVVGDGQPIPLLARSYIQDVAAERDQTRQIQMFAKRIQLIMSRVAPMFEVMRSAAKTEPEIAGILKKYLNRRMEGMNFFIECVTANGSLRKSMDKQMAVETIWALTSAEVYNLLRVDRGWSSDEYEYWLAETLIRLLLP